MCVCVCVCKYVCYHVQVESEDRYVESVFSFNFCLGLDDQTMWSSLCDKDPLSAEPSQQPKKKNLISMLSIKKYFCFSIFFYQKLSVHLSHWQFTLCIVFWILFLLKISPWKRLPFYWLYNLIVWPYDIITVILLCLGHKITF